MSFIYTTDKFVNDTKQRGVILYVHKEVKATEVTVDKNGDFDEYIMCEVKTNTPGVTLLLTCTAVRTLAKITMPN